MKYPKTEKLQKLKSETGNPTGEKPDDPLGRQIGGDHYREGSIQPVEFIVANDLGFCEGSVIKYVTRHRSKNGAEDLKKAIHYLQLLLKLDYGLEGGN